MIRALFATEFKTCLAPLAVVAAVIALYVASVVAMYDPAAEESLRAMIDAMPELFAAFGMANQGTTLLDFLINYLNGMLLTVFPFVLILMLANKLVVRAIDRKTLACLLATPASRLQLAGAFAGALLAALAVLWAAVTACQLACCAALFPGELDIPAFLRVSAGLAPLWLFLAGLAFASACLLPAPTAALWGGGALGIGFYFVQMLSQIGDDLTPLRNFTPFSLYDAHGLAAASPDAALGAVALSVAGALLFAAGIAGFCRRDFSV